LSFDENIKILEVIFVIALEWKGTGTNYIDIRRNCHTLLYFNNVFYKHFVIVRIQL